MDTVELEILKELREIKAMLVVILILGSLTVGTVTAIASGFTG